VNHQGISAVVSGPKISSAIGSFDSIVPPAGTLTVSAFSLQINSQFFETSACGVRMGMGCKGWQQFIYSTNQCGGNPCVFIEHWLVNFGSSSPGAGWTRSGTSNHWWRRSPTTPAPPWRRRS
jgi:hypothetical protein